MTATRSWKTRQSTASSDATDMAATLGLRGTHKAETESAPPKVADVMAGKPYIGEESPAPRRVSDLPARPRDPLSASP